MADKADERPDKISPGTMTAPVLDMGLGSRNQGFRRTGKPNLKLVPKPQQS